MTDGLEKYEVLAHRLRKASYQEESCGVAAEAITELVAMVREARRDTGNSVKRQFEWKKRAEAAERIIEQQAKALEKARNDARNNALEEAAKIAEKQRPLVDIQDGIMRLGFLQAGIEIADAIRAVKREGK